MDCQTCQDNLLAYAWGELSPEETAQVEAALAQCPSCQAELRAIIVMRDAMDTEPVTPLAPYRRALVLEEATRHARERRRAASGVWSTWAGLVATAAGIGICVIAATWLKQAQLDRQLAQGLASSEVLETNQEAVALAPEVPERAARRAAAEAPPSAGGSGAGAEPGSGFADEGLAAVAFADKANAVEEAAEAAPAEEISHAEAARVARLEAQPRSRRAAAEVAAPDVADMVAVHAPPAVANAGAARGASSAARPMREVAADEMLEDSARQDAAAEVAIGQAGGTAVAASRARSEMAPVAQASAGARDEEAVMRTMAQMQPAPAAAPAAAPAPAPVAPAPAAPATAYSMGAQASAPTLSRAALARPHQAMAEVEALAEVEVQEREAARSRDAQLLLQTGLTAYEEGRYRDAADAMRATIGLDDPSTSPEARYWLARALLKLDRAEGAERVLREFLRLYPGHAREAEVHELIEQLVETTPAGATPSGGSGP